MLRAIELNGVGDLYLPGAESYIDTATKQGLIKEVVQVGFDNAAMMVRKGNPKNIKPDLQPHNVGYLTY